ncbi:MAG: hypothetical protein JNL48_20385 [Acidobacteria bacterium]|nr:hypothetical protein [Acidobacteriota bacterium]
MTRARILVATAVVMALAVAVVAGIALYRRTLGLDRRGRETPEMIRQQIVALDTERTALRARLEDLVTRDPRLDGMPDTPVRVAVPTTLARHLVQRVIAGVADQVTLELRNIRVRRTGTVRRVVTLGTYDLKVSVDRVVARLRAGTPRLTFGSNRVAVALPLTVASGTGSATVDFTWDGRTIGGAVCGDMHITQPVTGSVVPRTYPLSGALDLTATDASILVRPRLPRLRVHVDVTPAPESLAAAQKILDDKRGLCGFVLDRVDVMGAVNRLIKRGFDVRVPTEKVKAMALPVGVEPTLLVRGEPVALGIRVGDLAITEHAIWLGAHVTVAIGNVASRAPMPR